MFNLVSAFQPKRPFAGLSIASPATFWSGVKKINIVDGGLISVTFKVLSEFEYGFLLEQFASVFILDQ
jgi:hypothetical protein